MQTTQRIFNFTEILGLYVFSRQNSETFDISYAFLPLTVATLSNLKKSVFGPSRNSESYP